MRILAFGSLLLLPFLSASAGPDDFGSGIFSGTGYGFDMPYRLFTPSVSDADSVYPLILYLHGSGGLGLDNVKNLESGARIWAEPENQALRPCFVLVPQISGGRWEKDAESLTWALVDSLVRTLPIDTDRVYVTGASLGGGGAWTFAIDHPERVAAAVPISGWSDPERADRIIHLPVWVFHGEADATVWVDRAREMVDALLRLGSVRVLYTEYPGTGHNIGDQAYHTPDLPKWLFSQTLRGKPATGPPSPGNPASADLTDHSVRLTWNPVISDPETWFYRVMRDGLKILETDTTEAVDAGLADAARHVYEIRAVDYRLDESQDNPRLVVTTPADTARPRITSVHVIETSDLASRVRIRFSEPMERSGLGDARNFGVLPERTVLSADPGPGCRSAVLSLPPLEPQESCILTVTDLRDASSRSNPVGSGSRWPFRREAWMWDDIGDAPDPGSFIENDPGLILSGHASDVHDTADACTFAYRNTDGDFSIEARIDALGASHPDSKAGLMIRETLDPGSPHFSVFLTRSGQLITHVRKIPNGKTIFSVYGDSLNPPLRVRVERRGDRVRLSSSEDGLTWRDILRTAEMKFTTQPKAGICVSSFERRGRAFSAEFGAVLVASIETRVDGTAEIHAAGSLRILGAHPNPSNGGVRLKVRFQGGSRDEASFLRVRVFNALGRRIRLDAIDPPAPGGHEAAWFWDGADDGGRPAAGGIYVIEVTGGSGRDALKVALIR